MKLRSMLMSSAMLLTSTAATAQTVSTVPPAVFDPLSADQESLAKYGFPPNPGTTDLGYQDWKTLVSNPGPRLTPAFRNTFRDLLGKEHTIKVSSIQGASLKGSTVTATNWAGAAIAGNYPFGVTVYGTVLVQNVAPPSACGADGTDLAWIAQWAGTNGLTNETVQQQGWLTAVSCEGVNQGYYAWYEAFPQNAVLYQFTSGGPGPGDFGQTATTTYADSMLVYVKWKEGTVSFTVPYQAIQDVSSAECITEAPGVNGVQSVLAEPSPSSNGSPCLNAYTANPSTNYSSRSPWTTYNIDMFSPYTLNVIATGEGVFNTVGVQIPNY